MGLGRRGLKHSPSRSARMVAVIIGAILIALVVIVVFPLLFWTGIGLLGAGLGWLLKENAEATHPGSELIETNY
jgi:hypothetical protein